MYLQGALELLDAEGEWAVRDGVLYYWPFAQYGVAPSALDGEDGLVITAPIMQRVFSFIGKNSSRRARGITLQGLVIVGASMPHTYVYDCAAQGSGSAGADCSANGP